MNTTNSHHSNCDATVRIFPGNPVLFASVLLKVVPEPTPTEQTAIAAAVEVLNNVQQANELKQSSWWRAGLAAALEQEPAE